MFVVTLTSVFFLPLFGVILLIPSIVLAALTGEANSHYIIIMLRAVIH